MVTITKVALEWLDIKHAPLDKKIVTFSKCKKIIISSWIESENRWVMYSKDELPLGWFPIPDLPDAADRAGAFVEYQKIQKL